MTSTSVDALAAPDADCGCDDNTTAFGTVRLDSAGAIDNVLHARVHWRVFVPRLQLVVPGTGADETYALQKRVDKLSDACGCDLGSAVALIAGAGWLVYALNSATSYGVWGNTWRTVAAMFIGATVGKLVGIARARMELRRVLVDVRSMMQERH